MFTLACIYRSPTPNKILSTISIIDHFKRYNPNDEKLTILVGDLNYRGIDWVNHGRGRDSPEYSFYCEMLERGYDQLVKEPTHTAGGILDLVFVNNDAFSLSLDVNDRFSTSNHYMVNFSLGSFIFSNPEPSTFRNLTALNFEAANCYLSSVDWQTNLYALGTDDPNRMCEAF